MTEGMFRQKYAVPVRSNRLQFMCNNLNGIVAAFGVDHEGVVALSALNKSKTEKHLLSILSHSICYESVPACIAILCNKVFY